MLTRASVERISARLTRWETTIDVLAKDALKAGTAQIAGRLSRIGILRCKREVLRSKIGAYMTAAGGARDAHLIDIQNAWDDFLAICRELTCVAPQALMLRGNSTLCCRFREANP